MIEENGLYAHSFLYSTTPDEKWTLGAYKNYFQKFLCLLKYCHIFIYRSMGIW